MYNERHYLKRKGIFFCIVGPAGGGKTTISERLLATHADSLSLSISVTSRPPRADDVPGVSYHFVDKNEFRARIERGDFFEWEENHGHFYGTLKSTIEPTIRGERDLLLVIDIKGALHFKRKFPEDTVITFLVPPSFSVLKARLLSRGSISAEELATRVDTARYEYGRLLEAAETKREVDYLIVNDALENTYQAVLAVFLSERTRLDRLNTESVSTICCVDESTS